MKIKTSELQGAALDWAAAKCEGKDHIVRDISKYFYAPSTDWNIGGPLIEREEISLYRVYKGMPYPWCAERGREHYTNAPSPLIAAMRCYVASKLGDEVEVPDELGRA